MRHIFLVIIALFLFFPFNSFAEVKEIISEGTYNMGDGETPTVAGDRALLQAKRTALEQAGTYVESYTKVKNYQLTEDEIKILASGIMEVTILDKKRTIVGDGLNFYVKIKAKVNPDNLEEMVKKVKDKSVVDDYKKIQADYDKSQREIEELKKQLAQAKNEGEKKQVEAKITNEDKRFQAIDWFEKGYQHTLKKEHDSAIEAYTNAIAIDPNYAYAYNNRGNAYGNKGQNDRAISDFQKNCDMGDKDGCEMVGKLTNSR
ncbi:MAG: tetratricopeptide repeat protein [Nitrospinae bacterium]|nr:tetratricopeptide repeat protein [Nitrospinota bacterium]